MAFDWGGVARGIGKGLSAFFTGGGSSASSLGSLGAQATYNAAKPFFQNKTQPAQAPSFWDRFKGGAGDAAGGVLGMFGKPQTLLGAGLLGAGLMKGFPKAPPNPASVEQLRSTALAGGGPMKQLATGKLTQQLNQEYQPLSEPEIQAALRQTERDQGMARDRVTDMYHNLRPGGDLNTDSAYLKDVKDVEDQFSRQKSDILATRTRDTKAMFDNQRAQQIQQAIGADDTQMAQLAEIAQLDVQRIMTQLQMDYQSALNFKNTFQSLGGQLLLSGLGADPFGGFHAGGN